MFGVWIGRRQAMFVLPPVLVIAASVGGCKEAPSAAEPRRYDVLLVTLDTTRVDYLGCYAAKRAGNTPHFDALAAEGAQFMLAIAQSASTPPSHASIMTGLYPFQHGVRVIYAKSGYRLDENIPYLPQILKRAGWRTAAFLSSFTVSEFFGFDRAFDTFDNGLTRNAEEVMRPGGRAWYTWDQFTNQRRSDKSTDAAIRYLDTVDKAQPFFLWVHYWDPHDWSTSQPLTAPPPEFTRPFFQDVGEMTDAARKRAMYAAEVAFVDRQYGRLVEKLKAMGRYDDTIVVVVADHGQGLGEHDWWAHRILYQEQIHVPLIVRVPGWPAGRRVADLVRTVDIYPTILQTLGIDFPRPIAGRSLQPLIHGRSDPPRLAYADALNRFDTNAFLVVRRPRDGNLYCMMDETWKLIWRYDEPKGGELYHIVDDPDEADNLFTEFHPQVQRLHKVLAELDPFRAEPLPDEGRDEDQEAIDALRDLGYIGD